MELNLSSLWCANTLKSVRFFQSTYSPRTCGRPALLDRLGICPQLLETASECPVFCDGGWEERTATPHLGGVSTPQCCLRMQHLVCPLWARQAAPWRRQSLSCPSLYPRSLGDSAGLSCSTHSGRLSLAVSSVCYCLLDPFQISGPQKALFLVFMQLC